MRKKVLFPCLILPLLFLAGCIKDDSCQAKTVASEEAAMQAYITANGITATRHSSGMYYEIVNFGSGASPTINSSVSVMYIGKLTDGTIFDQTTSATPLYSVTAFITGWQLGLPLIQEGGVIRLVIPSSLGYGCTQAGTIPPNSILYFEIGLVDVQ